jgi:hypothetical protein
MKRLLFFMILLTLLLLTAGSAVAMSSPNFRLDWFTPMTGSGGGAASSPHFTANFTVSQTVIGPSASENYGSGLGYWYGLLAKSLRFYLPMLMKN